MKRINPLDMLPQLTLEMIKEPTARFHEPYRYNEIFDMLIADGYTHLGWANGGVKSPDYPLHEVYINRSGSSTLYVNHEHKTLYSVDMGD